jgi:hypothetical protein
MGRGWTSARPSARTVMVGNGSWGEGCKDKAGSWRPRLTRAMMTRASPSSLTGAYVGMRSEAVEGELTLGLSLRTPSPLPHMYSLFS